MRFITRPLEKWPRPETRKRTNGGYYLDYTRTLKHLERELRHLGVDGDVVIQMDIQEQEIRDDGMPRASARPRTHRIAISFTTKKLGAMTYYCDAHHTWQSNVRAIGLGLERLRLVEKTGIVSRGEQYTGFRALPGGIPMPAAGMTVDEAARILAIAAAPLVQHITDPVLRERAASCGTAGILGYATIFQALYRLAAKVLHPDGTAPSTPEWQRLQDAAEILKKHHGIA